MMHRFYKHILSLPLFFLSIGFAHATDNNTPPPPLPINHVACDITGTNCAGVGYIRGNGFTDCQMGQCYLAIGFYTNDKGNQWNQSVMYQRSSGMDTYNYLYGIACDKSGQRCTAVGAGTGRYRYSNVPLTYVTHNGGKKWYVSLVQPQVHHTENDFRYFDDALKAVTCDAEGKECVTVGYYGYDYEWKYKNPITYMSHDGGNTWILSKQLPSSPGLFSVLNEISCDFATSVCLAKGYYQETNDDQKHPMAFRSNDLGDTWQVA